MEILTALIYGLISYFLFCTVQYLVFPLFSLVSGSHNSSSHHRDPYIPAWLLSFENRLLRLQGLPWLLIRRHSRLWRLTRDGQPSDRSSAVSGRLLFSLCPYGRSCMTCLCTFSLRITLVSLLRGSSCQLWNSMGTGVLHTICASFISCTKVERYLFVLYSKVFI